jgi:hypothetical protein
MVMVTMGNSMRVNEHRGTSVRELRTAYVW